MFTFLQLKQKSAEFTQHVSYPNDVATYDTNFLSKTGTWLNLSQERLAQIYDFWTELKTTYDFDTESGTEAYSMPEDFDKPFRVYDLTNKKELKPTTEEKYVDENISNIADATEGKPTQFRIYGVSTSRRKQMKLGLIPDDTYSVRVWYKKIPSDLSGDDDYPFIDADGFFIFDACGYAWKWEGEEEKAIISWQKAEEALKILLNNESKKLGTSYQNKIISQWIQAHRA